MTGAEKPAPILMKEKMDEIATVVLRTDMTAGIIAERLERTAQAIVQETVAALTTQLAALPPPPPSEEMALLLADCRDTITEGIGALHTQGADVLHALQLLQAPPLETARPTYPQWLIGVGGVVVGGLLMGATWWVWPEGGYRAFLVGLDAVLVKHYPQLPAPVQEAVTALYGRHQFQTPGSRQKGK